MTNKGAVMEAEAYAPQGRRSVFTRMGDSAVLPHWPPPVITQ